LRSDEKSSNIFPAGIAKPVNLIIFIEFAVVVEFVTNALKTSLFSFWFQWWLI